MPLVQIELTDNEAARVDAVAASEKRARKNQIHVMAMDRLAEIEDARPAPTTPTP